MPAQGRDQLKKYFRNGNLAREEYFIDLIDSSVNKVSDQFTISDLGGVNVIASAGENKLLSFYKSKTNEQQQKASFAMQMGEDTKNNESLSFIVPMANNTGKSLLFLKKESTAAGGFAGKVGINTTLPQTELDVNGAVAMKARIGTFVDPSVDLASIIADGKWHTIVKNKTGMSAYEIVAGVNNNASSYAMMYGICMNIPGRKGNIKPLQQIYSSWFHRIQLQWTVNRKDKTYSLEIRTMWKYKLTPKIQLRITKLWS